MASAPWFVSRDKDTGQTPDTQRAVGTSHGHQEPTEAVEGRDALEEPAEPLQRVLEEQSFQRELRGGAGVADAPVTGASDASSPAGS